MAALPRLRLALFASPCLALAGLGLPLTVFLPTVYAQDLGLKLSVVGVVFMAVRLVDIGFDPVLGVWMDRSRSRFGRFRPWLVAGTPLLMLATALLFFARPGVGPLYLGLGLLAAYAGWSITVLAQSAWGALLSPRYHERSRVYSWWQSFNLIGLLLILVLSAVAGRASVLTGVRAMGAYLLVLLPLTAAVAVLGVGEPAPQASGGALRLAGWAALLRRNAIRRILAVDLALGLGYGVEGALFLFYFTRVKAFAAGSASLLLLAYFAAALAGGPAWTVLARRLGKHGALAASSVAALFGLFALWILPPGALALACFAAVIAGLPYSANSLLVRAMMADAGDEHRLEAVADRTGVLYALLNATTKVGAALAVGFTFVGLDWVGFQPQSPHNGAGALAGLSVLFLGLPALCNVLGAVMLIGYPLDAARHGRIRAALEQAGP